MAAIQDGIVGAVVAAVGAQGPQGPCYKCAAGISLAGFTDFREKLDKG